MSRLLEVERRVIARVEATCRGGDSRVIVTNLVGAPRWLYEELYCGRGEAENLIKAHKLHSPLPKRPPTSSGCCSTPPPVGCCNPARAGAQ